ncbi:hypothetical protein T261_4837 [Streptomyces lydicus]|nr:hypothetical protein T261_4837 [Streptomyces lydicus]
MPATTAAGIFRRRVRVLGLVVILSLILMGITLRRRPVACARG